MIFTVCYFYQYLYIPIAFIRRRFPHKSPAMHTYAALICARNESAVIGNLIDSIKNQTYPRGHITIFVIADNCTDNTADIARGCGAVVYERFNSELVGKGYALNTLLESIKRDYGWDKFDGYFIFDADNVLEPDYIEQMNKTFSDGYRVITSYRNSKNYGDNWISAGYALWFLREARYLNHPRMTIHSSCAVSGTGFLFSREILEEAGGWNFFLLTEDIEFSVYNVLRGEKIGYCPDAVLYDEQPTTLRQSWRQRIRWARGYMQVIRKYGLKLLRGIFGKNCISCFDMAMNIMPAVVLAFVAFFMNAGMMIYRICTSYYDDFGDIAGSVAELLWRLFAVIFIIGAVTTISEWKKIHTTPAKKILYMFTFPLYMSTYLPIAFAAMFVKPGWKPIAHTRSETLEDIKIQ